MQSSILFLFFLIFSHVAYAEPQEYAHYYRPCYGDETDTLNTHLVIDKNLWTITHTAYEDNACNKPYIIYEVVSRASISGSDLDTTTIQAAYTSLNDSTTKALNMIGYCGFYDWKSYERKVVTGLLCDDFQVPAVGTKIYSIYAEKDYGREIFLGMPTGLNDGTIPQRRHRDLDPKGFLLIP